MKNKYKIQFHSHTKSDPEDCLFHTDKDLIDRAHSHDYDVLAITCHNKIAHTKELEKYAASKGILLVPGIEKSVDKKHVLIINASAAAENVHTFEDLKKYREKNPKSLVIAAHPYHPFPLSILSLGDHVYKHHELFDAVEFSSFHSKKFNFNKKAKDLAQKINKPMIGTSDTHVLSFLNRSYSYVYADKKNVGAIFDAIKRGDIEIISKPMRILRLAVMTLRLTFLEYGKKFINLFRNK